MAVQRSGRAARTRGLLIGALASLLLLGAVACSAIPTAGGGGPTTLKIGVSGPLTGPNADWGLSMRGPLEMAAEEIQQQGGVDVGGKKVNFQIVMYDDKFAPADAATVVNRLISQDGIPIIFGPTTGAAVEATMPIIKENNALQLHSGFGTTLVNPNFPGSFRITLTPPEYCSDWYQWVKANRASVKRVALMGPNDVVGRGSVEPCEPAVKAAGLTSESFYYERSMTDFTPVLTRVLAGQPDAIDLTGAAPAEAANIVKQLSQMGFKGLTMKSGGSAIAAIAQVAGPAANGHLYFEQVADTTDKVQKFYADFKKRYNANPEAFAPVYHDALLWLAAAMNKAGSTDAPKVRDTLEKLPFDGPYVGKTQWGRGAEYGIAHQMVGAGHVVEWQGGAGKVVGEFNVDPK